MTAAVHRLVTQPEKISRETAQRAYDAIAAVPVEQLPVYVREAVRNELYRHTETGATAGPFKRFTMISRDQIAWVWKQIREQPGIRHRDLVRHAFDLVLLNLRMDTGEVMLTRDQLADEMGCSPSDVSAAMGELAKIGAIEKETRRVPGLRGPGIVAYFVNADVAWRGDMNVRAERAAAQKQRSLALNIVGGTDAPTNRRRNRTAEVSAQPSV